MSKMMSYMTTIWWVTDPAYNPLAPSIALLTNARNISCAIESGYTLNPTDSATATKTSICDENNVVLLTSYAYEGSLSIFRDADLEETTSAYAKAWAFFEHATGTEGYLVRRTGKRNNVAAAIGDKISSFKFIADDPIDVVEDGVEITATIGFFQQGHMELFKAAVA